MPTLNGLLLGYPVVYVVEGGQEGAQAASRALSTTTQGLVLFQLVCRPLRELAAAVQHVNGRGLQDLDREHTLSAFTLPASFLSHEDEQEEVGEAGKDTAGDGAGTVRRGLQGVRLKPGGSVAGHIGKWVERADHALRHSGLTWELPLKCIRSPVDADVAISL
jgi:hypothetical protein